MKYLYRPHILFLILLFSPYLVKDVPPFRDIRFDHILLLFMGLRIILSGKVFRSAEFIPFVLMFLIFLCSTFISSISGTFSPSMALFINIVEWYGRGFIILLFLKSSNMWFGEEEIIKLFRIVIFASVLINVIALCQLISPFDQVVNPFLTRYYSGTFGNNQSYIYILMGQGRAISILAQTGTAGLYALLVFSLLLFLGPNLLKMRKIVYGGLLAQSLVGGFLPLSKAFILGVPIVLLIYCLRLNMTRIIKLGFIVLGLCIVAYGGLGYMNLQKHASYANGSVQMLASPDLIYAATFGPRFGEGSALDKTMDITKKNWLIGTGVVSGIRLCDSQWVPLLVFGGIIGLTYYIWYIITAVWPIIKRKGFIQRNVIAGRQILIFYLTIFFIYILFGIGSPTFSQDKTGDFFWILTAVLSRLAICRPSVYFYKGN
ncbi:MAG: hypothetical protein JRE23_06325 [Deltaproteobacteria bacterium]|nr:hypothetical protein [Deltaproteobacteria bacterium]